VSKFRLLIRILIGALALGLILLGIFTGDAKYVLENARALCFT
jgi:hypothetical protein